MKKTIAYFSICIGLCACAVTRQPAVNQVTLVEELSNGTITVSSNGFGNNLAQIERDAEISAFKSLLFVGLPQSSNEANRYPMIKEKSSYENSPIIKAFFDKDIYKNYITKMERNEYLKNRSAGNGRSLFFTMNINKSSLRKYLESNGIVRSFGY